MTQDHWKNYRYLSIDTETNSVYPQYARVIELAAFEVKDGIANQYEVYHSLFKPKKLESKATSIHGITRSMLDGSATLPSQVESIKSLVDGNIILGYNFDYDVRALGRDGVLFDDAVIVDVMRLYKKVFSEDRSYKLEVAIEKMGLTKWLTKCSEGKGLDWSRHRAKYDAYATACVFVGLMNRYHREDTLDRVCKEYNLLVKH